MSKYFIGYWHYLVFCFFLISTLVPNIGEASTVCDVPASGGNPAQTFSYATKTTGTSVTVCNPVTGSPTTVVDRIVDPAGTPTAGENAWVETADGYRFFVKLTDDRVYVADETTTDVVVTSNSYPNPATNTVALKNLSTDEGTSFNAAQNATQWANFTSVSVDPPTVTAPSTANSLSGYRYVVVGDGGGNGRAGALFVGARSGGSGQPGPDAPVPSGVIGTYIAFSNPGVEVASIGGKGGNGGNGYLGAGGASGGDGGAGGTVNLSYLGGGIETNNTGNHGIYALSRSGQGGSGGRGFLSFGAGAGTGGSGSTGGTVTVTTNGSSIVTNGNASHGIYGLSVGNNGGSGGSSFGFVGNSGGGGLGGKGGVVSLTNNGSIQTLGVGSHGILAQSIGGGGGDAGTSGGIVAFNDIGDAGGSGDAATGINNDIILTDGHFSRGIFVQSIGGGGGSGGTSGGLFALGGTGAGGGEAGTATAINNGTIFTKGIGSDGIMVQSIAGSGGAGGGSGGLVSIGGDGDKGGDGNMVTATNTGSITTEGAGARGIVAQSIGGGGGDGGNSGGMVALGGSGAGGGAGGTVRIVNTGSIETKGVDAPGIFAQSVGGGGGNGGSAGSVGLLSVAIGGTGGGGGNGGLVNADLGSVGGSQDVTTSGENSTGIFLQSVGGGGGNGGGAVATSVGPGFSASIAVGGKGGNGGSGGTVTAQSTATEALDIFTRGDNATGAFLQSVGGGGGNGGYAVSASISINPIASAAIGLSFGGSGGMGGSGGTVSAGTTDELKLSVVTEGNYSTGALFQSVGGGGGNGGSTISAAASAGGIFGGSMSLAMGGTGGNGGAGGAVTVDTVFQATTNGSNAAGLMAQSVGGGGGNGGGSFSGSAAAGGAASVSASVGLGGTAGGGGLGGIVTLTSDGNLIETIGSSSTGVIAQSIGGGGGNGGYAISPAVSGAGGVAVSASVALGGGGGGGGSGSDVTVDLSNNVKTGGVNSVGVLVQSVGGGGGNGGLTVAPAIAGAGGGSAALSFAMGGSGGSGSLGGAVELTTRDNSVDTVGDNATGVVVQSIGGGGGNGGLSVAASGAGAGGFAIGGAASLGGKAGSGGEGGRVDVALDTDVTTQGDNATGIVVQSVGGGGGNGGAAVAGALAGAGGGAVGLSAAVGGEGGLGQRSGIVSGSIEGSVTTTGASSNGLTVQSIGGGGGNGGMAIAASLSGAGGGAASVGFGLGGDGGEGGIGGTVNMTSVTGDLLTTKGANSTGLLVQSVGGGGGDGGMSISVAASGAGAAAGALSGAVGGKGGSGNDGGSVTVTSLSYTNLETEGNSAIGIVLQSVGGGGGNGGMALSGGLAGAGVAAGAASVSVGGTGAGGGRGGVVSAGLNSSQIKTEGVNSTGVLAQSVGGGGGNGGLALTVSAAGAGTVGGAASAGVGGSGGSGNTGAAVTLSGTGNTVTTEGDGSAGIVAQSIGGGGGNGAAAIAGAGAGGGVVGGAATAAIGGGGGTGSDGGLVTTDLTSTKVATKGNNAVGVLAQSVGGGGGNGGFSVAAGAAGAGTVAGAAAVGIGGTGGAGGKGGRVDATYDGTTLDTDGNDSTGILAQSIGGGGGNGGFSIAGAGSGAGTVSGSAGVSLGGAGGTGSEGGQVSLTADFDKVATLGRGANAVVAQSIGGGGGNGGFSIVGTGSGAGTAAGAVSVGIGGSGGGGGFGDSVTANIGSIARTTQMMVQTSGALSTGILAQSVGGGGGNGGMVIGGAGAGAGTAAGAVGVTIGGRGGDGNAGGAVSLTTDRTSVQTEGTNAYGVIAQSIGGGGGNGGLSVVGAGAGAGTAAGAVSVALGGSGGAGGTGGTVVATLEGQSVETLGTNSGGILAQSVGGGGGNGGLSIAGSGAGAGTGAAGISVALGGTGGSGNRGGQVTLSTEYVTISTMGEDSSAVVGQSIGGGGGNGGISIAASVAGAGTGAGTIGVGLGGTGGTGAVGGAVEVTDKTDMIVTTGANSYGVLAQSIGGGGGNGGFSIAATAAGASKGAGSISVGIGGGGGTGADGGAATLNANTLIVQTRGANAVGLASQSIGGGGGNGGMTVAAALNGAGTGAGAINVGLGGKGGAAGDGQSATTNLNPDRIDSTIVTNVVTTDGNDSHGILTQSVGGGGGNGGMVVSLSAAGAGKGAISAAIGLGGSGSSGGQGGVVNASGEWLSVSTRGNDATGIISQSLGGGGGNGGMSVTIAGSAAGKGSLAAGVGIGGSAGGGGDADAVTVDLDLQDVTTQGSGSHGVLSQSVGGGGGNGGMAVTAVLNASKTGAAVAVGVGGSAGGGGLGRDVTQTLEAVNDNGLTLQTNGDAAFGALAQSVGGGGGNGGISVTGAVSLSQQNGGAAAIGVGGFGGVGGDAGNATSTSTAQVTTHGDNSVGLGTQSIGGGGGNGATVVTGAVSLSGKNGGAVGVGVGGFGAIGGNAGNATSTQTGNVETAGNSSDAILTQSLGGGGGNGGTSIVGALSLSRKDGGSAAIGVGGFGGTGGDAGMASATVAGNVTTAGENARGVLAQSLGGGGGNGGTNVSLAASLSGEDGGAISVGVGGFGGGGGDANTVTLNMDGDVLTGGDGAHGLMAQSIGGGGGNGGTNFAGSLTITNPQSSDSSKVASIAIGVGGFGGGAGIGGDVDLTYGGALRAVPLNDDDSPDQDGSASGIIAQSIGGGGGSGGTNVAAGLSIASRPGSDDTNRSKGYAVVIGVGGFAGAGGNAGDVEATLTEGTTLTAMGDDASGLAASSIGGGGGAGGLNVSGGVTSDASLIVGIGGFGGSGGTSGDVTVRSTSDIIVAGRTPSSITDVQDSEDPDADERTFASVMGDVAESVVDVLADEEGFYEKLVKAGAVGDDSKNAADLSAGILAQSIGGGGGNGGMNISGGLQLSKDGKVPSVTFGLGGFGGAGAISGEVVVNHDGTILVEGHKKNGILAQSIAGGGGNGATNISGNLAWGSSEDSGGLTDLSIVAGVGGFAGSGADAGNVNVTSLGPITTFGDDGRGILAQSIGGGGGNGGMNITGVAAKDSNALALGVGGYGSGGGNAGEVSVTHGSSDNAVDIQTNGERAHGILAQSIGGGGGNGGANMILGYTGDAGSADSETGEALLDGISSAILGNEVAEELKGLFETFSDGESDDSAGSTEDSGGETKKGTAFAGQVAIGGTGGGAGNGNLVDVDHTGTIVTLGDNSHAIMAQSIGGGGGNAGINIAKFRQTGDRADEAKGFSFALGGGTGDGGIGADVNVIQTGEISTIGFNSYGVLAQSLGGGGGNAAMDDMSLDGDGGTLSVVIGRTGGSGGRAGNVLANVTGDIQTEGDMSTAVFAQSIGNGGGNSSTTKINLSVPVAGDDEEGGAAGTTDGSGDGGSSDESTTEEEDDDSSIDVAVGIGLDGGTGGEAGNVTVIADATLSTMGDMSHGVMAQSVGGGGGNGGSTEQHTGENYGVTFNLGGNGGTGGVGGDVTVTNSGDISTQGQNAHGIFAQSIGGSGGTGGSIGKAPADPDTEDGDTAEDSTNKIKKAGRTLAVNIGGSGGTGMTAGDVQVTNSGKLVTASEMSHGIVAQSIGGGGGNSGAISQIIAAEEADMSMTMTVSIGGDGGDGAASGNVTVGNSGVITTTGEKSAGIFAQAIGGGGGNADRILVSNSIGKGRSINVDLSFGGVGGIGAAAGDVSVTNDLAGEISTFGVAAHGIFAQSVGGGGGSGGTVESFGGLDGTGSEEDDAGSEGSEPAATESDEESENEDRNTALQLSFGGSGGEGGTGGTVFVGNAGLITTNGQGAHGIFAQSVGGGGGAGGATLNSTKPFNAEDGESRGATTFSLGFGGTGGSGNVAHGVTVENTGSIVVRGNEAYGIFAQSVGGGGGVGGAASSIGDAAESEISDMLISAVTKLNFGGAGGAGGDAGDVTVTHNGDITVFGDNSYGIVAQSVGGGGGAGGVTSNGLTFDVVSSALDTVMGGSDGATGQGGALTATSTGSIVMLGENSVAILRNAVSGGGGLSITNLSSTVATNAVDVTTKQERSARISSARDGDAAAMNLRLGSQGAGSNAASNIDATHTGMIGTTAANAFGGLTQSVGGGGGTSLASIDSSTISKVAVDAQLGASDSGISAGGVVEADRTGDLITEGRQSLGDLFQSVGGGGGVVSIAAPKTSSADLQLGSSGGAASAGGEMLVSIKGDTVTKANLAPGVLVQSIGAGGGTAVLSGMADVTVALGGVNGAAGDGGDVTLDYAGDVSTAGRFAHGIILQSIGGGGGALVTNSGRGTTQVNLGDENSGNGGAIKASLAGDVIVNGQGASGIVIQSLGGGGGLVNDHILGAAGGSGQGAAIDLTVSGNVMAAGRNANGVVLQSSGELDAASRTGGADHLGGDIRATFDAIVRGGKGNAAETAAIRIDDGADNMIRVGGAGFVYALNDQAMLGTSGNETVQVLGSMIGNIDLGAGQNRVTVRQDGYLNSANSAILGENGLLLVKGRLEPGGAVLSSGNEMSVSGRIAQTTDVTGSLRLTKSSDYVIDVRFLTSGTAGAGQSDLVNVTGDAAIGGTVSPTLYRLERSLPLVIIDSDGAVTNNQAMVADTVFLDYGIALNGETGDGSTIDLTVTPTFVLNDMTRNQASVGGHINTVLNGEGSAALGDVFALLGNVEDRATGIAMIDKLHGEGFAANGVALHNASQSFRGLTQAQATVINSGFCNEEECGWILSNHADLSLPATAETRAIAADYSTSAAGWHRRLDAGYHVGLSFGLQDGRVASGDIYASTMAAKNVGVYGFGQYNGIDISGMLHLGIARFDGTRRVDITGALPDGTTLAYGAGESRQDFSQIGLNVTASKTVPINKSNGVYVRPHVGLDIGRYKSSGPSETGLQEIGLRFDESVQTIATGQVGFDLGVKRQISPSTALSTFVGIGREFRNTDDFVVDTSFVGSPTSAGAFENFAELGDPGTLLSVGFSVVDENDGGYLDINYDKRIGTDADFEQFSIDLGIRF